MGLSTAAVMLSFLIAECLYRAEERGRAEWPAPIIVVLGLPLAIVAHQAAEADGELAAAAAVILVIAVASLAALWVAGGAGATTTVTALVATTAGGALFALEQGTDDDRLTAVFALASPLLAIIGWLVAKALHSRRDARHPSVHIAGFRPYPSAAPVGLRPPGRQAPAQPPRTLPPPRL